MRITVCCVASAPVRRKPSDREEMVTELLFGEEVIELEEVKNWVFIRCSWDNYEGWVDSKQLETIKSENLEKVILKESTARLISNKGFLRLSIGSELFKKSDEDFAIGEYEISGLDKSAYDIKGEMKKDLIQTAQLFLNTSYRWGGRSIFGIDCSGLTQICYKLAGQLIPRDASQQAELGEDIGFVEKAEAGDLAFFDNHKGEIIHVGLVTNNQEIIHASGHVRIDKLDLEGIFNRDLKIYTHKLRFIKRFA